MIPAGTYHTLLHGLKTEGDRCYLHATVLPQGERVKLRLFDSQITLLVMACMNQTWLPKNLKGGQAKLVIDLHPEYGNRLKGIKAVFKDELMSIESDVEINPQLQYCEFEGL